LSGRLKSVTKENLDFILLETENEEVLGAGERCGSSAKQAPSQSAVLLLLETS
jgi:hypothetical protein